MNRTRFNRSTLTAFFGVIWATSALAQAPDLTTPDILRDYRFITSRSTVEVSGGLPTYSFDLNIAGTFGLATGYDGIYMPALSPIATPPTAQGHASFVNVNGYLFNARSATPVANWALDLDTTLNLSGLKGTFEVPSDIHFTGDDGQGIPMQLEAQIHGPLLHLTGATLPVPTCASCGINMYKVDAFATIAPYADFNLDGVVDAKDLHILMNNLGTATGASFEQGDTNGDGSVDGADFVLWQRQLGVATSLSAFSDLSAGGTAVPEPTSLSLVGLLAAFTVVAGSKRHR